MKQDASPHSNSKNILIAFTGPINSGKSTACKILQDFCGFTWIDVGDPIRKITSIVLDEPLEKIIHDRTFKEEPGWSGVSPRKFMQQFGNDFCKSLLGEDFWIKRFEHEYKKRSYENDYHVCVGDIRFNNEAKKIRELGGFIVSIKRIDYDILPDDHASESGIDSSYIDTVVYNNYGLKVFYKNILGILIDLKYKDKLPRIEES